MLVLSLGLCIILPLSPAAADLRVPADHPTIQAAIDAAEEGSSVVVAPGEYRIQEPLTFRGKSITVRSEAGAPSTTIRMLGKSTRASVIAFEAGAEDDGVLEGFTITGGTGTSLTSVFGGGILCLEGTHPTLRDLVIVENQATYGGALYCIGSSPTLIRCVLARNSVTCGGGAFCDGASPRFISCTIAGNKGSYASSGVHSKNGSAPYLEGCRILGNTTYYGGGVDSFQSSPTLVNCILAGNHAGQGGAVYADSGSILLVHCTIVGNRADSGSGGIQGGDIRCCILLDNIPGSMNYGHSNCMVDENPAFVDPGEFDFDRTREVEIAGEKVMLPDFIVRTPDYRLRPGSPAIDRAILDPLAATDLDGNPRTCGGLADLGAYESCYTPFVRGDATADGQIDIADPIEVLGFLFLADPVALSCEKGGDVGDDGFVDISDVVGALGLLFLGSPRPAQPFPECGLDTSPDSLLCSSSACGA